MHNEGFGKKWIERILGKVDKDQGVANAGKVLGIGNDGQVVPVEQSGGGGSYTPYSVSEDFSAENLMTVGIKKGDIIKIPANIQINPSYQEVNAVTTLTLEDQTTLYFDPNPRSGNVGSLSGCKTETMYFYVTEVTETEIYGISPMYGRRDTLSKTVNNISVDYKLDTFYRVSYLQWLDNGYVQVPYLYISASCFVDTNVVNSIRGGRPDNKSVDLRGSTLTLFRI